MKLFASRAQPADEGLRDIKQRFERDGFVVLPQLFSAEACDRIVQEVNSHTSPRRLFPNSRITIDILQGAHHGRRVRVQDAPLEAFTGPFKINHLFTESAVVADAVFDTRLRATLHALLDAEPVTINSLNFRHGSQQPAHIDTWYMPPPKTNSLVVASLCLEDVHQDAGPLFYFPGSHRIPPYRFSHGGIHAVDAEMPQCRAYLEREIAARGLKKEMFLGRKGDVFLWHAQLLHGGTEIHDLARTRSSLVVHYWGVDAAPGAPLATSPNGGKYLDRDYWETDGKPIAPTPTPKPIASVPSPPRAVTAPAPLPAPSPAPAAVGSKVEHAHPAFVTWEAQGESLESVEARIHDGATRQQLHARADSYLLTFERFFADWRPGKSARMLEIGSGVGYVMEAALRRHEPASIIGLDVAQGMIDMAQRRLNRDAVDTSRVRFVHYDGVDVPLETESLDYVYSVASLQHAPRPYCFRALGEAYRLIQRGGVACIHLLSYGHFREHMTPERFAQELLVQIRGQSGHWHHFYSVDELEAVFRHGIGVPSANLAIREHGGSVYICVRKP